MFIIEMITQNVQPTYLPTTVILTVSHIDLVTKNFFADSNQKYTYTPSVLHLQLHYLMSNTQQSVTMTTTYKPLFVYRQSTTFSYSH